MTEMVKELISKVEAIEQKVQEGANGSANSNGGRKRHSDGDGENDAMPGLSRNGIDNQESKKSDMDLDDEPDTTEGDGLSFWLSEEGRPLWRLHLEQNWNIQPERQRWLNTAHPILLGLNAQSGPQSWPLHCRRKW